MNISDDVSIKLNLDELKLIYNSLYKRAHIEDHYTTQDHLYQLIQKLEPIITEFELNSTNESQIT